ncbi:hypothetical protein [Rhizobium sp. Leaf341]|uniref:hypothetical protein n=1 Tax=Rhizobium sp. Leaf341 TaxID=1736344 RepID=UPI000A669754|nr:hypothetical protein [Rhizobium sp. Leaf341]
MRIKWLRIRRLLSNTSDASILFQNKIQNTCLNSGRTRHLAKMQAGRRIQTLTVTALVSTPQGLFHLYTRIPQMTAALETSLMTGKKGFLVVKRWSKSCWT